MVEDNDDFVVEDDDLVVGVGGAAQTYTIVTKSIL